MDLKLRGKRALVTGSTAGIGFAIARGLARERAEVIVNGRGEVLRTMRPSSLIRRFAEPDEVANLVIFLAGEGSSATTGASLRVDGGVVRSII
jgi:NAD(P)-dependent dehydrogenase (short-subunit alcohol dehydrogenase family)